jgi:hypothetical protein
MKVEMKTDLKKRTKEFALRNIRLFGALPKRTEAQVLGKQLLRSATSVGASYREANRARSDSEFIAKIGICLQELDDEERQLGDGGTTAAEAQRREHFRVPLGRKCEQSSYWMELLIEAEIIFADKRQDLQDETEQLLAILTTISKKVKSKL